MSYKVPDDVRTILPPLAEAVLPIQAWAKQKSPPRYDQLIPGLEPPKYDKPLAPIGSVPWRPVAADPTLGTGSFDIVRFLEILADEDKDSGELAPRWNAIKSEPTKYFQNRLGITAAQWRAEREGLEKNAKFGVFDPDSSNFAFVGQDGPDDKKTPKVLSRIEFYDKCWPLLAKAYWVKPPGDAAAWIAFRDNLRTDQFVEAWPAKETVKSSVFIKQFTVEVLRACLGQRNKAVTKDAIWQQAVLIEVGENRHVGNAYSVQQAAQSVNTFTNAV
jgi:hypothetical protein